MNKSAYVYVVVRYVHDVYSAESLNVGILLWSERDGVIVRTPPSFARIQAAFPEADVIAVRQSIDLGVAAVRRYMTDSSRMSFVDAVALAIPDAESSVRASKPGGGVADDMAQTADELLERFVLRCDRNFEPVDVFDVRGDGRFWASVTPRSIEIPGAENDDFYWGGAEFASAKACVGV